jgi:hypothetical protein
MWKLPRSVSSDTTDVLIDITTFRLSAEADVSGFLASDAEVQAELSSRTGFVRRTTARRDDGTWLVLTFWYDAAHADADEVRLPDGADAQTLRVERFDSLD